MSQEKTEGHPMAAIEYVKVRAVLERITGLRRAMTATAVIGAATSAYVFFFVAIGELVMFKTSAFSDGIQYGVASFAPFIALIGYLSYRVNRHIDRLSRGKYEPPMIIE